jgi:hypothetical protein
MNSYADAVERPAGHGWGVVFGAELERVKKLVITRRYNAGVITRPDNLTRYNEV